MQTVFKMLFFFTLFYAITTEKVKYSLIYESGSWCDYWTDLGLVNIQVRQNQLATEKMSNFSMMLHDEYNNTYRANCTVLPQYEEDENPNVKPTETKNSNAPSHHDEDTDNMNEDEDEFYEDQTEDEKIPDKEKETDEAGSEIPKKNSDIKGTEKAIDETDKEDLDEIKDTRENLDEDEDEKEGEVKKGNSDEYPLEGENKEGENEDKERENKEGENKEDEDKEDEDKEGENKEGENKEGENEGEDEDKEGENKEDENEGEDEDKEGEEENENTQNLRNLEEYVQAKHAFCYFDPPKVHANLYYVENTLELPEDAKFEVEVMDNFFIMAQACPNAKDAEKKYNVNLSFRQLNHFKNENGKISFNFYGLTLKI